MKEYFAAGDDHSLIRTEDGNVLALGGNFRGQLGQGDDGHETDRDTPTPVDGLNNIVQVSAGVNFSMALTADGNVWTWGRNDHGQLGDGTEVDSNEPVQVITDEGLLGDIIAISAGYYYSLTLDDD